MSDYNKMNSNNNSEPVVTGWEDMADYEPKLTADDIKKEYNLKTEADARAFYYKNGNRDFLDKTAIIGSDLQRYAESADKLGGRISQGEAADFFAESLGLLNVAIDEDGREKQVRDTSNINRVGYDENSSKMRLMKMEQNQNKRK